ALTNVAARRGRFTMIEDDEVMSASAASRLRCRGLRLFVPVLAVNDRGESLVGVALHVLPDIQHRTARRVDERAAALLEGQQELHRDPECRKNHHVVRGERSTRLARIAEE